jgi:hypothetical protein
MSEGLKIGVIIHYVDLNEEEGTQGEYAAIISHIWHDDVVSLHVFKATGVSVVHQVGWSFEHAGNSWHWSSECDLWQQ